MSGQGAIGDQTPMYQALPYILPPVFIMLAISSPEILGWYQRHTWISWYDRADYDPVGFSDMASPEDIEDTWIARQMEPGYPALPDCKIPTKTQPTPFYLEDRAALASWTIKLELEQYKRRARKILGMQPLRGFIAPISRGYVAKPSPMEKACHTAMLAAQRQHYARLLGAGAPSDCEWFVHG